MSLTRVHVQHRIWDRRANIWSLLFIIINQGVTDREVPYNVQVTLHSGLKPK